MRFVEPHVVEIKGVYKNIKCALEWLNNQIKDMSSTKINLLLVGDKIKIQIIESLKHRNSSEKKQNTGAAEVEKSLKLCSSSEKKQNTGAAEEVKEQRDFGETYV